MQLVYKPYSAIFCLIIKLSCYNEFYDIEIGFPYNHLGRLRNADIRDNF